MANPKNRQQWVLEILKENPELSYSDMFGKYSVKYGKSNRTFDKDWKAVTLLFNEYKQKLQAEKDEIRKNLELEFVKNGLKTKYERILTLQKQVDHTEQELEVGTFTEMKKDGDKVLEWDRPLTPYEKAMLRRTIRQLQSEISKIEGDYADKKFIHANDPENPIEASQVVIFQLPDNGRN